MFCTGLTLPFWVVLIDLQYIRREKRSIVLIVDLFNTFVFNLLYYNNNQDIEISDRMSSTLYKQSSNFTHSTGSFLESAPVELVTVSGYEEFLARNAKHNKRISTVLSADRSTGYALEDGQVVATIHGEAKSHLLSLGGFTV